MQAALDSAHSMRRMGSIPRTSSAKTLNSAEQPAPNPTPGAGPQAPNQQGGGAHQSAPGQHRSSQPHRPDQTAGPEGSVQQPLLTRQGSKGPSAVSGVRTNGHARCADYTVRMCSNFICQHRITGQIQNKHPDTCVSSLPWDVQIMCMSCNMLPKRREQKAGIPFRLATASAAHVRLLTRRF